MPPGVDEFKAKDKKGGKAQAASPERVQEAGGNDGDAASAMAGNVAATTPLGLALGVAISTGGVSPGSVGSDMESYIALHTVMNKEYPAIIMATSLGAVGNVKRAWAQSVINLFSQIRDFPGSFRSSNGPNFRGFTVLGYMMMIGLEALENGGIQLHNDLKLSMENFKAKTGVADIRQYVSIAGLSDREAVRDEILQKAKLMFQKAGGIDARCSNFAKVLNATANGHNAHHATQYDAMPAYDPAADLVPQQINSRMVRRR